MEKYSHKCIKCSTDYKDTDPDPYLCKSCQNEKNVIAKQVDRQFGSTVGQRPNGMALLEEVARERGKFSISKDGRNSQMFISAEDAGLKI